MERGGARRCDWGARDRLSGAPRCTVWDLITIPGNRPRWQGSDSVVENTIKGRRGAGTQNHCIHGKDAIIEDILDWRPFDHITLTTLLPVPGAPKILMSYAFDERKDGGTHFEVRFAKPKPEDLSFYEHGRTCKANSPGNSRSSADCWRRRRRQQRWPTSRRRPSCANGS